MEHIGDILSSDLLDRYVSGNVTQQEKIKVDLLRIEHKVIRDKLKSLELSREKAIRQPKEHSSEKRKECIIKNINNQLSTPTEDRKVVQLPSLWWKFGAAFLIGILASWIFWQLQARETQIILTEQSEEFEKLLTDYELLSERYEFINHSGTIPVVLKGTVTASESKVIIYWNNEIEKSLLRVVELPSISANQTFQLWADINDQMHNLGTFNASEAIIDAIPINYLPNAHSLNITIEPKGGSKQPNLSTVIATQSL